MKKWTLVFFMLLTVTSSVPWLQPEDCCIEIAGQEAGDDGNCSPFISCSGCHGFTLAKLGIEMALVENGIPVYFQIPYTFLLSSYHASLWEPPREMV